MFVPTKELVLMYDILIHRLIRQQYMISSVKKIYDFQLSIVVFEKQNHHVSINTTIRFSIGGHIKLKL
jgi:hypothetical protein